VFGHYVLANGVGSISSGLNCGNGDQNVALSLIKGSWKVEAPNGDIFLQEVRNPNGIFNTRAGSGFHLFDYDPHASVSLNAGGAVYLTGLGLPRIGDPQPAIIYPPSVEISAGSGGIILQDSISLFPSSSPNLVLTTTDGGNLETRPNPLLTYTPALV